MNTVTDEYYMLGADSTLFVNGYTNEHGFELYAGNAAKYVTVSNKKVQNLTAENSSVSSLSVKILSNPVDAILNLRITSSTDQNIILAINNIEGKALFNETKLVGKGSNDFSVNCTSWVHGLYVVTIHTQTNKLLQAKFIK